MTRLPLALGLVAAAGIATSAAAVPVLTFTSSVNGEGNNVYLFSIESDSAGAYAVELAFEGDIVQRLAFGGSSSVDDSTNAALFDGVDPGYSASTDTFYNITNFTGGNPGNNPFTGTETTGYSEETGGLFFAAGSGTDPVASTYEVIQVVSTGDVTWSGIIAQDGTDTQVSGSTAVPEPGSLALLGLGGIALLRRRR